MSIKADNLAGSASFVDRSAFASQFRQAPFT